MKQKEVERQVREAIKQNKDLSEKLAYNVDKISHLDILQTCSQLHMHISQQKARECFLFACQLTKPFSVELCVEWLTRAICHQIIREAKPMFLPPPVA